MLRIGLKKRLVYQFADNNALMTWLHYGAGISKCHQASLKKWYFQVT